MNTNTKSKDVKGKEPEDKDVQYVCIAVEIRDAILRELVKAPFGQVAPLMDVLSRIPVNSVKRSEIKNNEEEKVSSTGGDSNDTAA